MSNNFENKRQSADSRSKMPEPIKLSSQEMISQAKDEADIDQAITEKNKEEALKSKFLQDEAEAKDRQEKGQPVTAYSQYKLAIMEELLKNKAVDFPKLVRQLKDADQPADFNLADCYEAFEMIRYYSNNPQELVGDYKTGQFNEVGASTRASNDFLNPNVSFGNKIDSLKAVMPDNSTMAVNGLTFLRSNDQMYLRLANNKVVALSSPEVVNRLLQARRAALAEIAN